MSTIWKNRGTEGRHAKQFVLMIYAARLDSQHVGQQAALKPDAKLGWRARLQFVKRTDGRREPIEGGIQFYPGVRVRVASYFSCLTGGEFNN